MNDKTRLTYDRRRGIFCEKVWDTAEHGGVTSEQPRDLSCELYHSPRWARVSQEWRRLHPLCEDCRKRGRYRSGDVVNHVVPFPLHRDFFDSSNFQTLCRECNAGKVEKDSLQIEKYRSEERARVRQARAAREDRGPLGGRGSKSLKGGK